MAEFGSRTLRADQQPQGNDVLWLQLHLANSGFDPGPADGVYGPRTANAVRQWQRSQGIAEDGIVGPQTWGTLRPHFPTDHTWHPDVDAPGGGASQDTREPHEIVNLGPELENRYRQRREEVKTEHALAEREIETSRELTRDQKNRALRDLREQENQTLRDLRQERDMRLRGLAEEFQELIDQQPEKFAARGLSRSGLLLSRLNELEEKHGRQARDITEQFGIQQRRQKEQGTRQRRGVKEDASDALRQLQDRQKRIDTQRGLGLRNVELGELAARQQLASDLNELGQPLA